MCMLAVKKKKKGINKEQKLSFYFRCKYLHIVLIHGVRSGISCIILKVWDASVKASHGSWHRLFGLFI